MKRCLLLAVAALAAAAAPPAAQGRAEPPKTAPAPSSTPTKPAGRADEAASPPEFKPGAGAKLRAAIDQSLGPVAMKLGSLPAGLRQTCAWAAIVTLFNAGVVWLYVLLIAPGAAQAAAAHGDAGAHPPPPGAHAPAGGHADASHGPSGDGHGAHAAPAKKKDTGHGAPAKKKDDGHGSASKKKKDDGHGTAKKSSSKKKDDGHH